MIFYIFERFGLFLSFLYYAIMRLLHYPTNNEARTVRLAIPVFIIALLAGWELVFAMAGRENVYVSHLFDASLICLALMLGFAEQRRLQRRLTIQAYVDEYLINAISFDRFGLDREGVISVLEVIGYQPGQSPEITNGLGFHIERDDRRATPQSATIPTPGDGLPGHE